MTNLYCDALGIAVPSLEVAGIAPASFALASLKKCKPARPPVYRDGDRYALDPHDDEVDHWAFRLGLRPPRAIAPRPPRPTSLTRRTAHGRHPRRGVARRHPQHLDRAANRHLRAGCAPEADAARGRAGLRERVEQVAEAEGRLRAVLAQRLAGAGARGRLGSGCGCN